jgi:hypothetical protein
MIHVTEIRLGNFVEVHRESPGEYITVHAEKVTRIAETGLIYTDGEQQNGYEYYPVILNDGWLVALGFHYQKVGKEGYHLPIPKDNQSWMSFIWKDGKMVFEHQFESSFASVPLPYIKSVHQIQNLYHSLTGKELI